MNKEMTRYNEILLRRKNKFILPFNIVTKSKLDKELLATILKSFESVGYMLGKDVIDEIKHCDKDDITIFYKQLMASLKKITGADKKWSPMYPNFPSQVMNADESELYLNAIVHYIGVVFGYNILPKYEKEERLPFSEKTTLKVITLGSENDIHDIFNNLMQSKVSISENDKVELKYYLENTYKNGNLPVMNYKEIISFVFSTLFAANKISYKDFSGNFKTATDVLRLIVGLSDGDVSLATKTKFRKFKRSERRLLLDILEHCGTDITEDMLKYKNEWIKIGEILHPFEYKKNYPKSYKAFDVLRNNKDYSTYNSQVELSLMEGSIKDSVKLLSQRPGHFARRLDHLLGLSSNKLGKVVIEKSPKTKMILKAFGNVADDISSRVLLQVMNHFNNRSCDSDRYFMPKGNVAKIKVMNDTRNKIGEDICNEIVDICRASLEKQYGSRGKLGNVYIDDALKSYMIPMSQRSANKSLRSVARGSSAKINGGNAIRLFCWWKNINNDYDGRVDIDLSCVMYDKDWNSKGWCSWTQLRDGALKAYHSGDITSAPDGACEFIDIDISSAKKQGVRYIMPAVFCFTGQNFAKINEVFCGFMTRKDVNSGEIFEAKSVQDRIDLGNETNGNVPFIFDVEERTVIYADLAITRNVYGSSVENSKDVLVNNGKYITRTKKTSLYELFELHAKSRGKIVNEKDKADVIFSLDKGITPFDIEKISAEYV